MPTAWACFSDRKIAQACERNLAFIAIVGEDRPDFRTISDFRKLHLEAFCDVFVAVLRIAAESGLVKLGNVSTDGTEIQGTASRHKAMSYGYRRERSRAVARRDRGAGDGLPTGCRRRRGPGQS